jgi:hypothetical protein
MTTLFLGSFLLLVLLLFIHFFEKKVDKRFFNSFRVRLDFVFEFFYKKNRDFIKKIFEYIHKDLFLNFLHMATYMALYFVKVVENKLESIISFLRSFKNGSKK